MSFESLLPVIGVVVITGVFAGLMAGLLGVGGGIVIVPVLFWALSLTNFPPELTMHMAVATSLATIIFTSISSTRAHMKRGAVDLALLRLWGPGLVIGALLGGLGSRHINADGLKLVFGVIGLLVAVNMLLSRKPVLAGELPKGRATNTIISVVIGGLSALMGIGGGTLSVPTLTMFSVEIRRAVGTASAYGVLIAIPAVLGHIISGAGVEGRPPLSLGYVSLPAALLLLPFTIGTAPLGAALAHRIDGKWIKRIFGVFLAATAARMLLSVF